MAVAVVQHTATAQGTTDASGNTTTPAAWPSPTTAGNLLVGAIIWNGNASPGAPTGWVNAASATNGTGNQTEIWYKANCIASDAVPVWAFTVGVHYVVAIAEISGAVTTTPLDKTGSATTGAGSAVAVGSAITGSSEFVYFVSGRKNSSGVSPLTWGASTAAGSATFQADLDQVGAAGGVTNVALEHTWAISGASGTSPSVTPNYTGITGIPVHLIATFKAAVVPLTRPETAALQAVQRSVAWMRRWENTIGGPWHRRPSGIVAPVPAQGL